MSLARLVSKLVSSLVLVTFLPSSSVALGGCGGGVGQNAASQALKTPELPTDKQAKCKVAKSQSEPLIVEWPDAARGRLESVSRRGLVAVRYEGCELAVLPRCTVRSAGGYSYSPITRKQSKVTIKDADELYASMPVGAVKLESKLQSTGQLNVQMTIVGRYETGSNVIYREDLEGECGDATHVIAALTVGSFTFSAGSDAEIGGGATVLGAGGGAKSTAARETIQRDGDEAACTHATIADKAPPEGCGALLQIEVMPLAKGTKAVAALVVPPPAPVIEPVNPPVASKLPPGTTKPAAKPIKPTIASAAVTACAAGQHAWNGRCVDDEPAPGRPDAPPPPSYVPTTCQVGTHLERGACVTDAPAHPSYPSNDAYNAVLPPTEQPNPWRGILLYVGVGASVSAAAFGYAALNAAGAAVDACDQTAKTCTSEAEGKRSTATTSAILADVSLGVAVLSFVGIFLLPAKVKIGAAPTRNGVATGASWLF